MSRRPLRFARPLAVAGVLVAASAAAMPGGAAAAAGAPSAAKFRPPSHCGSLRRHTPDIRHVIVIAFENADYGSVIGRAPYMTALSRACGLATNFFAETHPSLPNYIAMTSGTTGGLRTDCSPTSCPQRQQSIFGQLVARGKLWQGFAESMPSSCDRSRTRLYVPRHNPAVYYPALRPSCLRHDVRMGSTSSGSFHRALNHRLGAYVFVTPNICNDGHDCPLSTADRWLAAWMPVIRGGRVYQAHHTAVIVTFDEGGGANHIATIVVSPYVRAGLRVSRRFDHYSMLRGTEYALGIRSYLGRAAARGGFGTAFGLR